jgi:hypothetical protein
VRWLKLLGVIAGVLALAGAAFVAVIVWQFSPHVQPEYLAELRADPMARYEADGLTRVSTVGDEAADTWKGFSAAELVLGYSVSPTMISTDVIERAAEAAQRHGWARDRTYVRRAGAVHQGPRVPCHPLGGTGVR